MHKIAPALKEVNDKGEITAKEVIARQGGDFVVTKKKEITLMEVSPKQLTSLASAHIPFLEHNDANRALMGANMQRQAVPLIKPEAPIVATGIEQETAKASPQTITSDVEGTVVEVSSDHIIVEGKEGKRRFDLLKFARSNQGTSITQ
jgi:DNA-directed RNA polymerase subunit beta